MSDETTTGPDTGGWGAPAGIMNYCSGQMEYGGMIWYGDKPPTKEDLDEFYMMFGDTAKIDAPTLLGLPSHRDRVKDKPCYKAPVVEL